MSKNLIHGGDWFGYEQKFGREALDFSADVSPLGLPESLRKAAISALDRLDRYPDPLSRRLRKKLSENLDLPEEYFIVGNGAADLVFRLVAALRPKKALITAPTFAEYGEALSTVACEIKHYLLKEEDGFAIKSDICDMITEDVDIIFICEPNNPTGITSEKYVLEAIIKKSKDTGTLVVLDECFNDFLEDPESKSMVYNINNYDNIVILRSFTKMYAMAGARLGYGISSNAALLDKMRTNTQAWPVSSIAEEMGIAALSEREYYDRVRSLTFSEKRFLKEALEELVYKVIEGEANYLLFKAEEGLREKLLDMGIMIRGCDNYVGLSRQWYRVGVRTHDENLKLISAIREIKDKR